MARELERLLLRIEADTGRLKRELRVIEGETRKTGTRLERAFARAGRGLESFARNVVSARSAMVALAGASALGLLVKRSIEAADEIGKTADKLGISTDALQEYRFAAELTGVSQQQLEMGLQRLGRRLGEIANFGKGEARAALERLGIGATDAAGRARTLEQVIPEIADALGNMADQNERLSVLQKLVDSEGVALINTWGKGAQALRAMSEEAHRLGIVLDERLVREAEAARDELTRMEKVLGVAATRAALGLMPAMQRLASTFTDPAFVDAVEDLGRLVANLVTFFIRFHPEILSVAAGLLTFRVASGVAGARAGALAGILAALAAEGFQRLGKDAQDTAERIAAFADAADRLQAGPASRATEKTKRLQETLADVRTETAALEGKFKGLAEGTVEAARRLGLLEGNFRRWRDGTVAMSVDLAELDDAMRELGLARAAARVIEETRTATERYNEEVALLNDLLARGRIGQEQFNRALADADRKLADAKERSRNVSDAARDLGLSFQSAFEDAIVEGKALSEVLQGLEQDIIRILARKAITEPIGAIAGPLFEGLFSSLGSSLFGSARGNVIDTGRIRPMARGAVLAHDRVVPFASGGIVTRPTVFPLRRGTGLMGEAGPEAILPLARLPGGDLGVKSAGAGVSEINVIVVNNAGAEVRTRESRNASGGRDLEVVLDRAVARNIRRGGETFGAIRDTFAAGVRTVGR